MAQHNFENDNKYHQRSEQARRSTLVSVVVNIFLSALQIAVGIYSGSQGLIADGMHSFSDLLADGVVLVANKKSRRPSDHDHHYGHWRYENGASLVLGAILVLVGVGMLWSAAGHLAQPQTIPPVHSVALWMALTALVVKEGLFRYMLAAARRLNSSLLIANAWHARSDAASSMVVALGIIGNLAGFAWFDPLAALAVGLVITRMGYRFAATALNDLMDRAVDEETQRAIAGTLRATPGVAGLHDLKTRKAGDLVLVDVHLEVAGELSVAEGHQIARQARERVMAQHPVLNVMVHLDPCAAVASSPGEANCLTS
ncbi:cation diffusion facilitator family transporter [Klebsiella quasipneumoniae]|uniref:cation diffusion facilitator family transporter n=1 Tax=Klebsiella quasipneumoniae TaxID=1463165 RepID=UPI00164634C6|nr:cation diffusion facilitator family transporter [Klebsiella quasipneumoniae]MBC4286189.1 cation transporter [Klebsiella quasipneumoniae]HBR1129339.1 cation transporter [Klebsiella quasipneumoniae subsp. similipneumoniae]HEN4849890.1 cation transporter [Klebsiella quasipneumoniae subsp. similipneumoniae]HEN5284292.1 cation transporter [Klebsiella quasipneumoniae subsp. similipneumoniae]